MPWDFLRKAHFGQHTQPHPPSSVKAPLPSRHEMGHCPAHESCPSPAMSLLWQGIAMKTQWTGSRVECREWKKHPGIKLGVSTRWAEMKCPGLRSRHRGHTTRTTQQPYLLRFLCLACQGSLSQCPLRDTGRRPLAQANCWLCPPWSHTSAPPSAAGASSGQTGAWLWWAMRKVIVFRSRWNWNSQPERNVGGEGDTKI